MATLIQVPIPLVGAPVDVSALPKRKALVYATAPTDNQSGFIVQMSTDGVNYDQGFQINGPSVSPVDQAIKFIRVVNAQGVGPVGIGTNIPDGGLAWNFVSVPTARVASALYQPGQSITVPPASAPGFQVTDNTVTWTWQEILGAPSNWVASQAYPSNSLIAVPVTGQTGEVNYWIAVGVVTSGSSIPALSGAQVIGTGVADGSGFWYPIVAWEPSTLYTTSNQYVFANNQVYLCTTGGTSTASPIITVVGGVTYTTPFTGPSAAGVWVTLLGGFAASTAPSTVGLTGPFPPAGPPNGTTVTDGTVVWQFVPSWTAATSYFSPISFVYANGNVYLAVTSGTSAYPAGEFFCSGTFQDSVTSVTATGGVQIPLANQGPQGTGAAITNAVGTWALVGHTLVVAGTATSSLTTPETAANLIIAINAAAVSAGRADIVASLYPAGIGTAVQVSSTTSTPFTLTGTALAVLSMSAGTYAGAGVIDGSIAWDFTAASTGPSLGAPAGAWAPGKVVTPTDAIIVVPRSDGNVNTWLATTPGLTSGIISPASPIPAALSALAPASTVTDGAVTWTLATQYAPNATFLTTQFIVVAGNVWQPLTTITAGPTMPLQLAFPSPPGQVPDLVGNWQLVGVGGWTAGTLYAPNSSIIVGNNVWITIAGLTSTAVVPTSLTSIPSGLLAGSPPTTVFDGTGQWQIVGLWYPATPFASGVYIENEQQGGVIYVYQTLVAGVSAGASGPGAVIDTLNVGLFPNGLPDNFTVEYVNGLNSDSVTLQGSPDNINWTNLLGSDGSVATFSGAFQNRIIAPAPIRYLRALSNTPQSRVASMAIQASENVINFSNALTNFAGTVTVQPKLSAGQGAGLPAGTPLFGDVIGLVSFTLGAANANKLVLIEVSLVKASPPIFTPEAIFVSLAKYAFPFTADPSGNITGLHIDALFYLITAPGGGGTTDTITVTVGAAAIVPL